MSESRQCRCPVRPYYRPGSFGSGSTHEDAMLRRWQEEHGSHEYANARDELARALRSAEGSVRSGEAVLDMVADVFELPRFSTNPSATAAAIREASRGASVAPQPEQV